MKDDFNDEVKNAFYNTPEKIRLVLEGLEKEDRDQIILLITRDPFSRIYSALLIVYLLILSIILLWPFDMSLPKKNDVTWIDNSNGIQFTQNGLVRSKTSTKWFCRQLREGQGLTLEAWVASNDIEQFGPARIMSYSVSTEKRNFTIGQHKDSLVFRLRTTETDLNGVFPFHEVGGVFATNGIKHIVVTYDFNRQIVYVDGVEISIKNCPKGTFENWDPSFPLLLGNEVTWERPWSGKIFYAAIYNRALETSEVERYFLKGQNVYNGNYCSESEKPDGLLVQYCFNEGNGDIIRNSSGKNARLYLSVPNWTHLKGGANTSLPVFRYTNDHLQEVVLNIVAFMPLGFLLHALWRIHRKISLKVAFSIFIFGALLSSVFEFIQFFSITRYPSLLDVLHNTVGTGLGVAIDRWYSARLLTRSI